jgi:hypothetical protein
MDIQGADRVVLLINTSCFTNETRDPRDTVKNGIDSDWALQVNEAAAAFSGLVFRLHVEAKALLVPILWSLLF